MLTWAKIIGVISTWEGTLFQVPFVKHMKLRRKFEHAGELFLGPDGLVLNLRGRTLHGATGRSIGISQLDIEGIKNHAKYGKWLKNTLFAGGNPDSITYTRQTDYNSIKACDRHVNSIPYAGGLLLTAPGASAAGPSSTPVPRKRKSTNAEPKSGGGRGGNAKRPRKSTQTPAAGQGKPNKVNRILSKVKVTGSDDEDTAPKNTGNSKSRREPKTKLTITGPPKGKGKGDVKPPPLGQGQGKDRRPCVPWRGRGG
jgi:hypothetical protein